ncbi:hypothetical protein [Aquamicrobium ahrensii]|uniref:Uncharacterized protein n=1 Tax=Aquamicrobium ahrensii TaxID=469551 RepID=A0ABV2KRU7_9HYPH
MNEVINGNKNSNVTGLFNSNSRPIVSIDVERYKHLIDDPAIGEDEKEAFLHALWSIIVAFVDLGFGVHPLQEVCGESEHAVDELNEVFDRAKRTDSNCKNKVDGSPAGGLEME